MSFNHRKVGDSTSFKGGIRLPNDRNRNIHDKNKKIAHLEPCLRRGSLPSTSSRDVNNLNKIRQRNDKRALNRPEVPIKRVCSEPVGDFWSRVDSGEIDISSELMESKLRSEPKLKGYKVNINNYNIITTNVCDYSYKTTPFGDVYYSPRFQDDKYIYRYVILTKGVKNEAYRILKNSKTFLLTEHQIIRELGIDLSPGWEHFMLFRNRLDELILRRRL